MTGGWPTRCILQIIEKTAANVPAPSIRNMAAVYRKGASQDRVAREFLLGEYVRSPAIARSVVRRCLSEEIGCEELQDITRAHLHHTGGWKYLTETMRKNARAKATRARGMRVWTSYEERTLEFLAEKEDLMRVSQQYFGKPDHDASRSVLNEVYHRNRNVRTASAVQLKYKKLGRGCATAEPSTTLPEHLEARLLACLLKRDIFQDDCGDPNVPLLRTAVNYVFHHRQGKRTTQEVEEMVYLLQEHDYSAQHVFS